MSFAAGVEEGLIRFVGDDCKRALYDAIGSPDRFVRVCVKLQDWNWYTVR